MSCGGGDDGDADDDTGPDKAVDLNDVNAAATYNMRWNPTKTVFDSPFSIEWGGQWLSGDCGSVQVWAPISGNEFRVVAVDFYGIPSNHIKAQYFSGSNVLWQTCVPSVDMNTWYHFEVDVNTTNKTYSVKLDGNATSCTNLNYNYSGEGALSGLVFFGYSDTQGEVQINNVVVKSDGTPVFEDGFEGDTTGSQPAAPWVVTLSGGATATVIELP